MLLYETTSAFEKITVSSTAKALTAATYGAAQGAVITVETDQVRYRADGTDPDGTTGHLLSAGDVLTLSSPNDIQKIRFIRVTGDATLQVSYLK